MRVVGTARLATTLLKAAVTGFTKVKVFLGAQIMIIFLYVPVRDCYES